MGDKKAALWCIGFTLILLSCSMASHPQPAKSTSGNEAIKTELEHINRSMENDYLNEKADSLLGFYEKSFTYLPEYKPPIYEPRDLKKFYADWFRTVQIESYHKTIYEVEPIAGYVLEIGSFLLCYSTSLSANIHYTGKYMTMWKRSISGKLNILSEAFGSDKYIKPEDIPYATVEVREKRVLDKNILNQKLLAQIEEFDQGVVKAVLDGDGAERAREFTTDGIYMPHFDPMQIGMDMIKPYMLKTYQPGVIKSVKDTYSEIFDLGGFVFLSGHFKVAFDNGTEKGSFEGNMSNLMIRGEDGKLLMYRQLAHN